MAELWKHWKRPGECERWGPRSSNPYLGVSRRRLIPYAQVLYYVCEWEGLPCNVPNPNLSYRDMCAISEVWRHEHDCREWETRDQRRMDRVPARPAQLVLVRRGLNRARALLKLRGG